jgi:branched-chain amino acid transport system permease protein
MRASLAANPLIRHVLLPVGQILAFILGSGAVLSAIVLLLAVALRGTVTEYDLLQRTLEILPKVMLDGVTFGFVYASIALGYTMVYGILEFINFAHSEIFMIGGIVGLEFLAILDAQFGLAILTGFAPYLVIAAALVVAMLASGGLALGIERVAYRPLRSAPRLVPLISAIGVSFFLQDAVRFVLSITTGEFDVIIPTVGALDAQIVFSPPGIRVPIQIQAKSILIIVVAMAMLLALNFLVNATRVGKAIRAVAQDRSAASLMGINVNTIIAITFLIGGALGGAAGVLFALKATRINAFTGFLPGLRAFTAAVLGGIGNLTGALLGGLVLGMIESFSGSYLSMFTNGAFGGEYKDIITFGILIVILIFRPSGLLGQSVSQKA